MKQTLDPDVGRRSRELLSQPFVSCCRGIDLVQVRYRPSQVVTASAFYPTLLHVAMQFGLSHLFEKRAWRIVSEDSGDRRPFLLIVRTLQIVTADHAASTEGCSEFPAYSQVYLRNYNDQS